MPSPHLPGTLGFSAQNPGSQSITFTTTARRRLTSKSIAISLSDRTFIQTNNGPATLNPNTNCVIAVFTPPDAGTYSATLSVTDSDKSSPRTAPLSGVGADN